MSSLHALLNLPSEEKQARGLQFTPREIAQQPETWRGTVQRFSACAEQLRSFLERAGIRADLPPQRPTVMLVGAGTSDYIGHALAPLIRLQWGCEAMAVASTDLLSNMDEYVIPGRSYLWISFSRSGDSPEGVAVLEQALESFPAVSHVIVTCNAQARMTEAGKGHDRVFAAVLDDAVNDRSLAMTSSFTNMVVFGQCLAHAWSLERYASELERIASAGERFLAPASECAGQLASRRFTRVCFVGSGSLAAIAKESALKVLEMSAGQVKTMSETVLGLRHGPMAALDGETLFVCFVSSEQRRQRYEIDLLREIRRKEVVGFILAVGPDSARGALADSTDAYLAIEGAPDDLYRAPVDVIFGQLLGLFCSLEHGLKPDAPSPAGIISRVVQDFRIYR